MSWDQRGYYYRSRREGSHVRREYVGPGLPGELGAEKDSTERTEKTERRRTERIQRERLESAEKPLADLDGAIERLLFAALSAAGFRHHKRGEWRKRRERQAGPEGE
jgi:hypothetical protein